MAIGEAAKNGRIVDYGGNGYWDSGHKNYTILPIRNPLDYALNPSLWYNDNLSTTSRTGGNLMDGEVGQSVVNGVSNVINSVKGVASNNSNSPWWFPVTIIGGIIVLILALIKK